MGGGESSRAAAGAAAAGAAQDFVVRAPPGGMALQRTSLGRFPLKDPDFAGRVTNWTVEHKTTEPPIVKEQWLLSEPQQGAAYVGEPERGQHSNYFIFMKELEGDDFVAIPVENWYNFKPAPKNRGMDLKDAERAINERKSANEVAALSRMSRLANLGIGGEPSAGLVKTEEGFGDAGVRGESPEPGEALEADAEDWEHEEEYDDDDEVVAVTKEDKERLAAEQKFQSEMDNLGVDLEEELEGPRSEAVKEQLEQMKRDPHDHLRRLIKEEEGGDDMDMDLGDDDDMDIDEDDIDAEMERLAAKYNSSHGPAGGAAPDARAKRELPAEEAAPAKRAKVEPKTEAPPPAARVKPPAAAVPKAPASRAPSEREVRELLEVSGKLLVSELIGHFKKRLKSKADKEKFMKTAKRVGKLQKDGGKSWFVPRGT